MTRGSGGGPRGSSGGGAGSSRVVEADRISSLGSQNTTGCEGEPPKANSATSATTATRTNQAAPASATEPLRSLIGALFLGQLSSSVSCTGCGFTSVRRAVLCCAVLHPLQSVFCSSIMFDYLCGVKRHAGRAVQYCGCEACVMMFACLLQASMEPFLDLSLPIPTNGEVRELRAAAWGDAPSPATQPATTAAAPCTTASAATSRSTAAALPAVIVLDDLPYPAPELSGKGAASSKREQARGNKRGGAPGSTPALATAAAAGTAHSKPDIVHKETAKVCLHLMLNPVYLTCSHCISVFACSRSNLLLLRIHCMPGA